MTTQIGDIYKYNEKKYSCFELTSECFNPCDYGLHPMDICTSCLRGYWCEYEITENRLRLQALHIYDTNKHYPAINGVNISPIEYMPGLAVHNEGLVPIEIPCYFGHETYENIDLSLPYTGKMLLGNSVTTYITPNRLCDCRELVSLEFENGELKKVEDFSELAKILRKVKKRFKLRKFRQDKELYEKLPEDLRNSLWWRREATVRTSRRKKLSDFKK